MAEVVRQALVPFTTTQMFNLVCDIPSYPEFVPHCAGSEILQQDDTTVIARLDLEMGLMAKSFTTRNHLVTDKALIMELEQGPFRYLHGKWNFKALGDEGCRIDFDLSFEFSNQLASLAFNKIFKKMSEKLFDAFLQRAEEVCK